MNELPDPSRKKTGAVNLVVCYMIPVFFRNADAGDPEVSWRLKRSGGSLELVGRNKGGGRPTTPGVHASEGGEKVR
jgi:fimbrial chaperone protein